MLNCIARNLFLLFLLIVELQGRLLMRQNIGTEDESIERSIIEEIAYNIPDNSKGYLPFTNLYWWTMEVAEYDYDDCETLCKSDKNDYVMTHKCIITGTMIPSKSEDNICSCCCFFPYFHAREELP